MPADESTPESVDSNAQHDESTPESINTDPQSFDHSDIQTSRRTFLGASGALALGTSFGVGTTAGKTAAQNDSNTQTAPETFEEFKKVVDETLASAQSVIEQGSYEPTRDSLEHVDQVPEWFRNAKFGIYFHWGLYSVPAYQTEWYPRYMYDPGSSVYNHHVDTYGPPDEYPYEEFAPQFTAEKFDPDEWVELFEKAGAQFTGPVAEHHDGWSNWDSSINPWNASDRGPERDLTGELASAASDHGLRFVTTFHHARRGLSWDRDDFSYTEPAGENGHYSYAYSNFLSVTKGWPERLIYANMSTELFLDTWLAKLIEVIDSYQPDLVWFDNAVETVPQEYKYRFFAYYYNWAAKNDQNVVVTRKQDDLPISMSVEDFEKGRPRNMQNQAWLTDTTLSYGAWCYVQGQDYKPADQILHVLIDIVSKNGQMLLNISPKADGTIPQVQRNRLLEMGDWLDLNGEAIYETRPWEVFGEGPTRLDEGGHFVGSVDYTPEDIRYTQSKDGETLYAIVMGWPGEGPLTLNAVRVEDYAGPPPHAGPPDHANAPDHTGPPPHAGRSNVTLLGYGAVDYSVNSEDRLTIDVPALSESDRPSDKAVVFKLTGFELNTQPADLTLNSSDIEFSSESPDILHVSATIHNEGYSDVSETTVRFLNTTGNSQTQLASQMVESVPSRGSITTGFDWDIGDLEAGVHKVQTVVDSTDSVNEISEENNTATNSIALPLINLAGEWRFHRGDDISWKNPTLNDSDWEVVDLPANWENHSDYTKDPAYGWYRKTITIPEEWQGHDLQIPFGKIDDLDKTFVNGTKVGESGEFPNKDGEWCCDGTWEKVRQYTVPGDEIDFGGENVIAIRVYDDGGGGGLYSGPLGPIELTINS